MSKHLLDTDVGSVLERKSDQTLWTVIMVQFGRGRMMVELLEKKATRLCIHHSNDEFDVVSILPEED